MSTRKVVTIYFVLPSHCEDELSTSEEMQQAFELCRQNQMTPEWIKEQHCISQQFDKENIVVFEKFEGDVFQAIKTRLSIVGPWCIITCLLENLQIPNNKAPIFNMAMYKLTVSASNYTAEKKKELKDKIEMMGGAFNLHLSSSVTHLVTCSVRTQKYAVANNKGIVVMMESWIEDVWNCSLNRNVKATDEEFNKHKCPCFKNLHICSTGFEVEERNNLHKLVKEHGGEYSGKLVTAVTDILICKPCTKSEKYEVARKSKIPCVKVEWVYDSVEKGFAQPENDYIIKVASSTPTKSNAPLNPDFSMVSVISGYENNDPCKSSVSDTINVSLYNISQMKQKENQEPDIINEIDLQEVKKAGTFLDGCGILLAGFNTEHREKLIRILRCSGATRYETLTDRVTQVIIGDPASHEVRLFKGRAPLVSPGWIQESIRLGQPAPEDPFIISTAGPTTPSSPLSKKGLTLLQNDTSLAEPEPAAQPEPEPEEHETLKIYKNNKTEEDTLAQLLARGDINSKCDTKSSIGDETTGDFLFAGKTFKLIDHPEEDMEQLIEIVEKRGGKVLSNNNQGVADYAIVPPISGHVRLAAAEIANSYWLQDCNLNDELLPLKYYHLPLNITEQSKPLKDCVITLSGYVNLERVFLMRLIPELGAVYQEKFARTNFPGSGVLASTHLVCLEAKSSKFLAAQRWKIPAVTHEWLIQCAETEQRLPEELFLRKNDQEESIAQTDAKKPEALDECKNIDKISPIKQADKKRKSPESDSFAAPPAKISNNEKDLMITAEDNRVVPFNLYMDELRAQGIFDTPSPIPPAGAGTPVQDILAKLRREGKLPNTPTRSNNGEIGASQGTPVGRYLRGLRERNVLPSSPKPGSSSSADSPVPQSVFDVKTPETPLGRFMGEEEPSRSTRKQWQRCLNRIPHYPLHDRPAAPPRRPSTPWSEVKRQTWSWINRKQEENHSEVVADPQEKIVTASQHEVNNQIGQLQDMLGRRESIGPSRSIRFGNRTSVSSDNNQAVTDTKNTQADTIDWYEPLDDVVFSETEPASGPRKFMISSVSTTDRTNICNIICSLGGEVSSLTIYDPSATHVVCSNPSRNEKILASMAAGLWIVHQSYIEQSGATGRFLPEEEYELGNPKAQVNIAELMKPSSLVDAIHWWRKRVSSTGKGAFYGMRALIFAKNEQAVARLLEAGGGTVIQASPPFDHNIDATHCFIDTKLKLNLVDYIPLAEQGIPCINILYLTNFLSNTANVTISDFLLPELSKYYN